LQAIHIIVCIVDSKIGKKFELGKRPVMLYNQESALPYLANKSRLENKVTLTIHLRTFLSHLMPFLTSINTMLNTHITPTHGKNENIDHNFKMRKT
jgi:hypothetical protein